MDDQGDELPIPGRDFGFARLIRAQAAGDYESLKERGRRVARVRLGGGRLMQLGMIGLGRMGGNMTTRLTQHGHDVKTFDPGVDSTAKTLAELRDQLDPPRAFWLMIPAGKITENAFQELLELGDRRRHDRRRRQLELPRLAAPVRRGAGEGHPLRRRGRLGRDLGARATATA